MPVRDHYIVYGAESPVSSSYIAISNGNIQLADSFDIVVSQGRFYILQVISVFMRQSGICMAQFVGRQPLRDACLFTDTLKYLLYMLTPQRVAIPSQQEIISPDRLRSIIPKVALDAATGVLAKISKPFIGAFAKDLYPAGCHIDIGP